MAPTALATQARRPELVAVPDSPLATVRDISTAPSARKRRHALRSEEPAAARKPHQPRTAPLPETGRRHLTNRARTLRIIGGIASSALATIAAISLGLAMQPSASEMGTSVYSVTAGDSVWAVAAQIDTDRPLEDVVTDIYRLNTIDGGLQVGQQIYVPLR